MLKTVRDAFKVKEIRQRIFYTFLMLIVVRIGCQIPLPNTTTETIKSVTDGFSNGALGFFNAMTGGSFERMSIFALNITPYITATIIIQLLTIAIPKLEELQKEGEEGRKVINKITRVLTVALAILQSAATALSFGNRGLFGDRATISEKKFVLYIIISVAAMTASATFLMWLGEQITEKGVGNGISIILLINIVARMPEDFANLYENHVKTASSIGGKGLAAVVIMFVIVAVVVLVVLLQDAERRIPVQYAKKMQGRRLVGGQGSHIPLKVNTAGVIPVIFAQSLLMFPVVIVQLVKGTTPSWTNYLTSNNWWKFNSVSIKYSIGYIVYALMVIGFAYFYTSITFNPIEVADNMKRSGGQIPGIRTGKPTEDFLSNMLKYVIFIGAIGLLIVATLPIAFGGIFNADVSFGGTSLIIVVGVVLETIKNIEAKMVVRNYKGFLTN